MSDRIASELEVNNRRPKTFTSVDKIVLIPNGQTQVIKIDKILNVD